MKTECRASKLEFESTNGRQVVASFTGNHVTSDSGLLLLRETAERIGLFDRLASCFTDHRDPERVEHTVAELLAQRIMGIACGYEDLNDHTTLRHDPLFALAAGKKDVQGRKRRAAKDEGKALASPATLNRLELTPKDASATSRYCKIVGDEAMLAELFVQIFLDMHPNPPSELVLDLDATDDPLHGKQEGRFFHGYYGHYCYLPLYIFCGDFLLCSKLRTANRDGADGALEEVKRIIGLIRQRWPAVPITLRADSGFTRDALMTWAEDNGVEYVLGLQRNTRLEKLIGDAMAAAKAEHERTGQAARTFAELRYRTHQSWTRERRVVAKAEYLPAKANPRFVVTSLAPEVLDGRALYEDLYCARGDMENRIKEQQLWLFADRLSAHTIRANQLRLWFSSMAYVLLNALRHFGLAGTELAQAQAGTIRTKLLKIGAVVTISVRRIFVVLSSASPMKWLMPRIVKNLRERLPAPS